jgi:hypothetical protein
VISFAREQELRRMAEHEDWMRLHPAIMFPPKLKKVALVCKRCGNTYRRSRNRKAPISAFCGSICRDKYAELASLTSEVP